MGSKTTRFLDTTTIEAAYKLAELRLTVSSRVSHVRIVEFHIAEAVEQETSRYLVYPAQETGKALRQMRKGEDMFEVVADIQRIDGKIVLTTPYDRALREEAYCEEEEDIALFLAGLPEEREEEAQKEGSLVG